MLYIHIPYCKGKCIYCDFYSAGNPDWTKYLKAVASELTSRIDELRGDSLRSIYIGGGTPSLIPPALFKDFIQSIDRILDAHNIDKEEGLEFTLEVNPEDITEETAEAWCIAGVNRISMGVQSMNDEELRFLKRRHNAECVEIALSILKYYFNNFSVDLIYGIPGQSAETLEASIEKLLSFAPNHFSAYALTYEDRTPLYLLRDKGVISECSDEEYNTLESVVVEKLSSASFSRYEISNYALPGFESRHNSGYWNGQPYLGLGPSACSFDGAETRRSNPHDLRGYISHFSQPSPQIFYIEERLTLQERKEEEIFTRLRIARGIDLQDFSRKFGEEALTELLANANRWIQTGHLLMVESRLFFSQSGFQISDHIILHLI